MTAVVPESDNRALSTAMNSTNNRPIPWRPQGIPWRPQTMTATTYTMTATAMKTWKTAYFQEIAKFKTSLDKFHPQVMSQDIVAQISPSSYVFGRRGLWPSWLWSSLFVAIIVKPPNNGSNGSESFIWESTVRPRLHATSHTLLKAINNSINVTQCCWLHPRAVYYDWRNTSHNNQMTFQTADVACSHTQVLSVEVEGRFLVVSLCVVDTGCEFWHLFFSWSRCTAVDIIIVIIFFCLNWKHEVNFGPWNVTEISLYTCCKCLKTKVTINLW